ncbi:MAG: hypothetical protein JJU29_02090 [Verrucomicrobia bacterium]|nr:hypothetical protein [Verrucomicrobiota bacterium]MCH8512026.1 hypothetical protein [Kiritimatiellia bacterium]
MTARLTRQSLLVSYEEALTLYINHGGSVRLQSAIDLGLQAVNIGMETLDLAAMHEEAMQDQENPEGSAAGKQRQVERSRRFFSECNLEIEKSGEPFQAANKRMERLTLSNGKHAKDLVDSSRLLAKESSRRTHLEKKLKKCHENKRLGLLGMRERVEMVGGTLSLESAPGKGTTLRVDIPNAMRKKASESI